MKVYTDINNLNITNPALTVGFFDGVHLGHQQIITELHKVAAKINGESVVFTLYPHPRSVLYPSEANLELITALDEKIELLRLAGIQHLIVYPFTKEFAKLTACEFIEDYLIKRIGIKHLVVGYDHHFGHDREGDVEVLKKCVQRNHVEIEKVTAFRLNDKKVSSSKIRAAIKEGDIQLANQFLNYNFFISGQVVEGNKLGRTIGFPTANVFVEDKNKLIPPNGVYEATVTVESMTYKAMVNIGFRPTINETRKLKSIEANILDFNQNIYKKDIRVSFIRKIRDEQKFANLEELKAQLERDKLQVS